MTINIAVATSEALVLACDSIASSTGYYIPAFGEHVETTADGGFIARYGYLDVVTRVTNSWGGVTKMFSLHQGETPVAAVTAGLAKLADRSMSSLALEFLRSQKATGFQFNTVRQVADAFLAFMRGKYDQHYVDSQVPEEYRDGPQFLLGGYGRADYAPSIYRLDVQGNSVHEQFAPGAAGIAWGGQSDAVERLLKGYDQSVRTAVESAVTAGVKEVREAMSAAAQQTLQTLIDKLGPENVPDARVELPEAKAVDLPWDKAKTLIDYANLPLQDAIDFAAYLVNLQSGRAKFSYGVPTVGGRTHIGLITRDEGFRMIDPAPLTHRNTGFV